MDSLADFIFFGVWLVLFIPLLSLPRWALAWVGAVVLIRLGAGAAGWVKYKKAAFLHTWANKATGLLVFFFPFLYRLFGLTATIVLLCAAAGLSALEELIIQLASKDLNRDIKGIWEIRKLP